MAGASDRRVSYAKRAVATTSTSRTRNAGAKAEDWRTVDETTGLSKYDQLRRRRRRFRGLALLTEFPSALPERNLELATSVWPVLNGDALEDKAFDWYNHAADDPRPLPREMARRPLRMTREKLEKLATAPADASMACSQLPRPLLAWRSRRWRGTLSSRLVDSTTGTGREGQL